MKCLNWIKFHTGDKLILTFGYPIRLTRLSRVKQPITFYDILIKCYWHHGKN